jgi:hypothetical protein
MFASDSVISYHREEFFCFCFEVDADGFLTV